MMNRPGQYLVQRSAGVTEIFASHEEAVLAEMSPQLARLKEELLGEIETLRRQVQTLSAVVEALAAKCGRQVASFPRCTGS